MKEQDKACQEITFSLNYILKRIHFSEAMFSIDRFPLGLFVSLFVANRK